MIMMPTNTCRPWKPVSVKKVEPKVPLLIENGACVYSHACPPMKIEPRMIGEDQANLHSLAVAPADREVRAVHRDGAG